MSRHQPFAPPGVVPDGRHPLNQGRVGWWLAVPPLDGGATLYDLMDLLPGTLSAATWETTRTARPSRPLLFNGTTSRVNIAGVWSGFAAGDSTLAAWFRTTAAGAGATPSILSIGNSAAVAAQWALIGPDSTGHCSYDWRNDAVGGPNYVYGSSVRNDGIWHLLAATKSGSTGVLYVDGVQEATNGTLSGTITTDNLTIGGWHRPTYVDLYTGSVADASVWDRALTAGEVAELYRDGLAGYPDTLMRRRRVAARFAPAPSLATLTGPTSGALGAKSTAFTVTLDRPAGAGGVVVRPASTGGADTFSSS